MVLAGSANLQKSLLSPIGSACRALPTHCADRRPQSSSLRRQLSRAPSSCLSVAAVLGKSAQWLHVSRALLLLVPVVSFPSSFLCRPTSTSTGPCAIGSCSMVIPFPAQGRLRSRYVPVSQRSHLHRPRARLSLLHYPADENAGLAVSFVGAFGHSAPKFSRSSGESFAQRWRVIPVRMASASVWFPVAR